MSNKTGRGRLYALEPDASFASREIAIAVAWLDELRERVCDQIEDLPAGALNFEAPGTGLTIGRLVIHLAWAEALWLERVTGRETPADLAEIVAAGALDRMTGTPPPSPAASELVGICGRIGAEITRPGLRIERNADRAVRDDGSTIRGVLGQLQWHWTYHSGQIGLLRFEWGSDYTWTMGGPMKPPS